MPFVRIPSFWMRPILKVSFAFLLGESILLVISILIYSPVLLAFVVSMVTTKLHMIESRLLSESAALCPECIFH